MAAVDAPQPMNPAAGRHPGPAPRTTALDIVIGLGLAVFGLPELFAGTGPWQLRLLLDLGLVPPLIFRRRSPTLAFATITVIALGQWLTGPHEGFGNGRVTGYHVAASVALLIAFYTIAATESLRRTVAAAVVLEAALLVVTVHQAAGRAGPALFVLLSGTATAAGVSGNNARIRRAYLASVEQRAAALEIERDQHSRLAAAAERTRIAREMHDVVAHNLSVMIALADGASYAATDHPDRAIEAMGQVSATGRQALAEMRRLLGVLRDGEQPATRQPQPGLGDLETLLAQVRLTGLRASLVTEGPLPALAPGVQLAVYRLVQEALTNTLKHATDAETVTVRLRLRVDRLEVDVIDDGKLAGSGGRPGLGIAGMRERAAACGGAVEVGPQAGLGWRVHASFDLAPVEAVQ